MVYYLRKYLLTLCLGDWVTNFVAQQLSLYKHSFPWVCVHGEVNICVKYLMKVCSLRSPGIFSPAAFGSHMWCEPWQRRCHLYAGTTLCEHPPWEPAALLAH